MATTNLNGFLRRLTRGMVAETLAAESDRQLVEQFLAQRGEAVLETIVRRHGPMVYRVCWRVLRQEKDTEGAFQATFLLLAQRVHTLRKRASLASWLHGVANRVALKAKAEKASRRRHEQEAAESPAGPPDEVTWGELRGILDSELGALPEKWRLPLVVCYLEGRTQDEAARQLGWSERTLRRRLEEARTALARRLSRRGVVVPAALSAILFSDCVASASLPARLVGSTIEAAARIAAGQAGTAIVSAKVSALAEGVLKTMLLTKLKTGGALLLVAVVIAASVASMGLPVLVANGQPLQTDRTDGRDEPAAAQSADAPKKPSAVEKPSAETKVSVSGRVLDPDGKPFAGAKLYLGYTGPKDMEYPVRATSGNDGSFQFTVDRSEMDKASEDYPTIHVMAVADGHGCDWAPLGPAGEELTLRLTKDLPISVRILDPEGQPVAGARLTVMSVSAAKGDDLGGYIEAFRKGKWHEFAKRWDGPLPGQPAVVTTKTDGRIRLVGVGRERVVYFRIEGPGIASTSLQVMSRVCEPVAHPERGYTQYYGASSDFVGHASRPVRGVVRDKETGKPLAGVSVEHYHGQGPSALTDKEGRYELLGLAKTREYALNVKPADGLHFQRRIRFEDTPGLGALTGDIELVRGLTVRGRVTDKETGKSIAGARVHYYPLGGNTYVDKLLPGSWDPRAQTVTGADGSYTITAVPGPGAIGVTAPRWSGYMPAAVSLKERKDFFKARLLYDDHEHYLRWYAAGGSYGAKSLDAHNAIVLLEPNEKDEGLTRDVALERPQERKGRIVGPDDRPLAGTTVYGHTWGRGLTRGGVETLKEDEFIVRSINPKENRPLVFYHKDKNLGFFLKDLRDNPADPLVIKLQPCGSISGRVLDPDGVPLAGMSVYVEGRYHGTSGVSHSAKLDQDGRFRVDGVVPGQEFEVWMSSKRGASFPRLFVRVVVESGKHKDMGELKAEAERDE
jgi:RNA polymerase sigma factor (sigma-70 family)